MFSVDPMMTEPDLVTIGDGASVDTASLIAHINTRGTFRLNPVKVGSYCVLKTMCRLLSGASMEDHSIMLEHTLVLSGETVDKGKVWQGWPAGKKFLLEEYREDLRRALTEAYFKRLHTPRVGAPIISLNSSSSGSPGTPDTSNEHSHLASLCSSDCLVGVPDDSDSATHSTPLLGEENKMVSF
jgi:hypothetical protein